MEHLSQVRVTIATPFWVVLSWAHSDQVVREWIATCNIAPLHATNSPGVGDLTLDELCESSIRRFVVRRAEQLCETRGYETTARFFLNILPPSRHAKRYSSLGRITTPYYPTNTLSCGQESPLRILLNSTPRWEINLSSTPL